MPDNPEMFTFSTRSKFYNTAEFFRNSGLDGGGHNLANGFRGDKKELKHLFKMLQKEVLGKRVPEKHIKLESLFELEDFDLFKAASHNELAYSNIDPVFFRVDNIEPDTVNGRGKLEFTLKDAPNFKFRSFTSPVKGDTIIITPTLINKQNGQYELMVDILGR